MRYTKIKTRHKSANELAYIGDAVHTLFVRENLLKENLTINQLNKKCSHFCSAKHQSKVVDLIADMLNDEEIEILKRGRNLDSKTRAKNASVEEYRKATAFETLVGFLYLEKNNEKLNQILELSLEEL